MEESQRSVLKRLITIQLLAFASFAPMNYYNVYLRSIGFNSEQLGLWGAVLGVVGMATLPFWGVISDRMRSSRMTLVAAFAVYAVVFALIPMAGGKYPTAALPLYVLIVLYGVVKDPTHSLQDAWMISTIAPFRGMSYASVRMWGSLGFGVVSIIFSLISGIIGIDKIFYLAPVCILPVLFIMMRFKEPEAPGNVRVKADKAHKINPLSLLKNYYYATALLMTLVLATYIALTQSFYAYILEHAQVDSGMVGLISGYGSLLQVGVMWAFSKYLRHIPAPKLLILGGLCGVIENVLYGISSGLGMMLLAATFWGLAISVRVSTLPSYLYSLVPREYAATAQTLNSTVIMVMTIAGNLIGGVLVDKMGITAYNFTVAGFQLVMVVLFTCSIPFGRKVLKIEPPASVIGGEY